MWQQVENFRQNTFSNNTNEQALQFEFNLMLIGQAINAMNFYRRKFVLLTLGNKEQRV